MKFAAYLRNPLTKIAIFFQIAEFRNFFPGAFVELVIFFTDHLTNFAIFLPRRFDK